MHGMIQWQGTYRYSADTFYRVLTHLPVDKMAVFSQTIVPDAFSRMKSFTFWLKFHWFVPKGSINNISALV